jgi:transposase-like protein/IS1 family transposase
MKCPTCQQDGRKFGSDRYGNQRYQCMTCRKTFSDRPVKPLDEMHLQLDKALRCLQLLTEGNSIRATVRISGVAKATVTALLVSVGQKCADFLSRKLIHVPVTNVEVDEVWGFVGMKEKTKDRKKINDGDMGDAYAFVGIERETKLVLSWYLGKRDQFSTVMFMEQLKNSTRGRFQMTTDGFRPYPQAVEMFFAGHVDYAQLVKDYATKEDAHRYSPGEVVGVQKKQCCGNPDPNMVCTSHVERHNLSIRMQNRRMTRLTNAFSKKWSNHEAALGLYFAVYNFVRPHGTLAKANHGLKTTPAMEAGLTDHPWTILELLTEATKSTQI